jgi:nicotinamidase-related amidase
MVPKDSWKIDPKKTAFVGLDFQNMVMQPGGPYEVAQARGFLDKVNEAAALCRGVGIPVLYGYHASNTDLTDAGLQHEIRPRTGDDLEAVDGRSGVKLFKGLDVQKGDYVFRKIRYSAFIRGSSNLEPLLRGLDRDSIILCGLLTDVCVGATAQDAMMLGFKVFLISDLTATLNDLRYEAALEVLERHFAKVMSYEAVRKELTALKKVS